LLGAVVAAYLPTLVMGIGWRADTPGSAFQLALEVLRQLNTARREGRPAVGEVDTLAKHLWVEALQLEAVLETLADLEWVGRLEDGGYALLVDPNEVSLQPLIQALLLGPGPSTAFVWREGLRPDMRLQDALG